jgi:hypothetical protein
MHDFSAVMNTPILSPSEFSHQDKGLRTLLTRNLRELFLETLPLSVGPVVAYCQERRDGPRQRYRIGEFGGGHGHLSRAVAEALASANLPADIDNVDIDQTKFQEIPGVRNVHADIRSFNGCDTYDVMLIRQVLQYLTPEERRRTLRNVYNAGKDGSLIVLAQSTPKSDDDKPVIEALWRKIGELTQGSCKTFPTGIEVACGLVEAGFTDPAFSSSGHNLTFEGYFRPRYHLNAEQMEELKKAHGRLPQTEGWRRRGIHMLYSVVAARKGI